MTASGDIRVFRRIRSAILATVWTALGSTAALVYRSTVRESAVVGDGTRGRSPRSPTNGQPRGARDAVGRPMRSAGIEVLVTDLPADVRARVHAAQARQYR